MSDYWTTPARARSRLSVLLLVFTGFFHWFFTGVLAVFLLVKWCTLKLESDMVARYASGSKSLRNDTSHKKSSLKLE